MDRKTIIKRLIDSIDWFALQDAYEQMSIRWQHPYLEDYTPTERELQMRVAQLAEDLLTVGTVNELQWGHLLVSYDGKNLRFLFVHDFAINNN